MTRQEAIRCLSVHSSTNGSGLCTDKQHYEAKQMAIKALEQEPKFIAKSDGTIEQIKNCDDCLFKKEWEKIGKLISVVLEKQNDAEYHGTEDMDGLYYCPICQQTTTVVKDGKCPKCGATMDELSTREQTEDAISRQAAIGRLSHWYSDMLETNKEQEDLIEVIKAIPSAEPKTGHWIYAEQLQVEICSCCGCIKGDYFFSDIEVPIKFCPNCGIKIVEPQESEDV